VILALDPELPMRHPAELLIDQGEQRSSAVWSPERSSSRRSVIGLVSSSTDALFRQW